MSNTLIPGYKLTPSVFVWFYGKAINHYLEKLNIILIMVIKDFALKMFLS